jgi:hypothetical protein
MALEREQMSCKNIDDSFTALRYACVRIFSEIAMALMDRGGQSLTLLAPQLYRGMWYGHTQGHGSLMDRANTLMQEWLDGSTPGVCGHTETAMALIDRGADIDAKKLMLAAQLYTGHLRMVTLRPLALIDRGRESARTMMAQYTLCMSQYGRTE